MAGQLDGKVSLITGAASGIGRASALACAREGARVVVADVDAEGGQRTVNLIRDTGGDATFVRADVSRAAEAEAMVEAVIGAYGRLDCAHNNAGIEGASALPADYPEESFDRVIAVNLKGVWLCMKAEIPRMLERGGGAIVNTASVAGLIGAAMLGPYAASKHGVIGLTKSAALAYARQNIRVNAVCPGVIQTPMLERLAGPQPGERWVRLHPVGRLGTPEDIAEAVVWLCSDAAAFVTGHALPVDGGYVAQ